MRKVKGRIDGCLGSRDRPDPWQKAIYGFEDDWPEACADSLSIGQCEVLIRLACQAYGLTPPKVGYDKKAKISYCFADGSGIYLVKTQRNKFIALHEAAHFITDKLHGYDVEDHGFEWQGIYFFLLSRAELAPECALKASAKDRGLLWRETPPEKK